MRPALRRLPVLCLALAAAGVVHVPASLAVNPACYDKATKAHATRHHGRPRAPVAIGDSIMIYSVPLLASAGMDADARPCRSFVDAKRMIRVRKSHGTLPGVVVIALGANGPFTVQDISNLVRTVGAHRRLAFVTSRASGGRPGHGVDAIRAAHVRYPEIVRVLDWVKLARGHPNWFAPDDVHLGSQAGIRAYTKLIRSGYRKGDALLGAT